MDCDSPSGMLGAQMDKWCSYPHSTTPLGPPHQKRGALHSGTPADAPTMPPGTPLSLHRLSFRHMQGNTLAHLGAILCVSLRWFKVSLIQGQRYSVTEIDDMAME
jgi:hypothetical protein